MKKIALGFATCGLILSSCSSNDVFEDNQGTNNPNVINFSATTTRATVNTLKEVQGGFPVYAVTNDKKQQNGNTDGWYIETKSQVDNIYKFFGNTTWKWSDGTTEKEAHRWPTTPASYPMNFYAYYPGTPVNDYYTFDHSEIGTLTATIKIKEDPAEQIDFLAANSENVTTKPAGGKLNLNFQHITSKVNFSIIAGNGATVYVQQMHMNNVGDAGTFNYNGTLSWSTFGKTSPTDFAGKYKYWPIEAVPQVELNPSGPGATTGTPLTTFDLRGAVQTEDKAIAMYPYIVEDKLQYNNDDRHMMLRPQLNTPGWTWTKPDQAPTEPIVPNKAYIESVYRISTALDPNAVGYTQASSHPSHPNYKKQSGETGYDPQLYNGPLFVKVGFPLGTSLTWTQGRAYNYNIKLGTADATGGIILDDNYYDNKGNRTNLTIDGKEEGDKVNDGEIHFNVTVSEWTDGENQPGTIQ